MKRKDKLKAMFIFVYETMTIMCTSILLGFLNNAGFQRFCHDIIDSNTAHGGLEAATAASLEDPACPRPPCQGLELLRDS